jgi:hypothetical protein
MIHQSGVSLGYAILKFVSPKQSCPICQSEIQFNPRCPRSVCEPCAAKAASADGRALRFSNISFSGGYAACYADTGEVYPSHQCFINGIACWADEAYFGGIVIHVLVQVQEEDPKV